MGQKRQRLLKFLREHPTCCFCGGGTPSETQDHIPPRSVFSNNKWPEGYVFPACLKCNNGSAKDDAIFALYSRFNPGRDQTKEEHDEFLKHLRAFNELYPGEARKSLLTANEKRRFLEAKKIAKPDGVAHGELPIVRFPPLVLTVIDRFARKLTLALHYKVTRKIVPQDAWVMTRHWSNLHHVLGEIPQEVFDLAPRGVELRRGHILLDDQFSFRFGISDDGTLGGYLAAFRKTLLMIGLVCFDAAAMRDIGDRDIDRVVASASDNQADSSAT